MIVRFTSTYGYSYDYMIVGFTSAYDSFHGIDCMRVRFTSTYDSCRDCMLVGFTSPYDSCHGHDCMIVRFTSIPMVAVIVMIV